MLNFSRLPTNNNNNIFKIVGIVKSNTEVWINNNSFIVLDSAYSSFFPDRYKGYIDWKIIKVNKFTFIF